MTRSILVVDDDQNILLTIQDILSSEGYPVTVARDGIEGLEMLEIEHPDLILLDLWMPRMSGSEMANHLRDIGVNIPILVMSAMQSGTETARAIGAHGFIAKPFDIDALLDEIDRLLGEPEAAGNGA